MPSRLKAKVKPAVLQWARESSGYTAEHAAKCLKVGPGLLVAWEGGADAPTIPQLRKLADLYKTPLAVLYLPQPPMAFMPMRDYRRMAGTEMRSIPPAIVIEERRARQRRELALELADDLGEPLPEFDMFASLLDDAELVAARVRDDLSVSLDQQAKWRDPEGRQAFKSWRERIERKGVLVFQSDKFTADEASGFAVWEPVAPIIVIGRKGTNVRRRTFSLLHEFAHLLVRASGLSDLEIGADHTRPPEESRLEIFCNAIAAATLVPQNALLSHVVVARQPRSDMEWSDEQLREVAAQFGVSREVILRRLLTYKRTTARFYEATRERLADEWVQYKTRQKATAKPEGIKRNMPQEAVGDLGRPFIGAVLERYHQDHLSLSEVSGYLGLKAKHVPKVEQLMRGAR